MKMTTVRAELVAALVMCNALQQAQGERSCYAVD